MLQIKEISSPLFFAKNPHSITLELTNDRGSEQHSIASFSMAVADSPANGEKFEIEINQIKYTINFSDTITVAQPFTIHDWATYAANSGSQTQYIKWIVTTLKGYPFINTNYDIIGYTDSTSIFITLKAKEIGSKFDMIYTGSCQISASTIINSTTNTDSAYELFAEATVEIGFANPQILRIENIRADAYSNAADATKLFTINELQQLAMYNCGKADLYLHQPNIADKHYCQIAMTALLYKDGAIADIYPLKPNILESKFLGFKGGVDNGIVSYSQQINYLLGIDWNAYFSLFGDIKLVDKAMPNWLTAYFLRGHNVYNGTVVFTCYDEDGQVYSKTINLNFPRHHHFIQIPTGYHQNGLDDLRNGYEFRYYTVEVKDNADNVLLTKTYILDHRDFEQVQYLAFTNHFGCWETIRLLGSTAEEWKITRITQKLQRNPDNDLSNTDMVMHYNEATQLWTLRSGYLEKKSELNIYRQIMLSDNVALITGCDGNSYTTTPLLKPEMTNLIIRTDSWEVTQSKANRWSVTLQAEVPQKMTGATFTPPPADSSRQIIDTTIEGVVYAPALVNTTGTIQFEVYTEFYAQLYIDDRIVFTFDAANDTYVHNTNLYRDTYSFKLVGYRVESFLCVAPVIFTNIDSYSLTHLEVALLSNNNEYLINRLKTLYSLATINFWLMGNTPDEDIPILDSLVALSQTGNQQFANVNFLYSVGNNSGLYAYYDSVFYDLGVTFTW